MLDIHYIFNQRSVTNAFDKRPNIRLNVFDKPTKASLYERGIFILLSPLFRENPLLRRLSSPSYKTHNVIFWGIPIGQRLGLTKILGQPLQRNRILFAYAFFSVFLKGNFMGQWMGWGWVEKWKGLKKMFKA